jgi:GNAT superfamily N-acetyltransferase
VTRSLTGLTPPLDADTFERDAPDRHLTVFENGELKARASVWWTTRLHTADVHVGAIGHYAADDERAGREVLRWACDALAQAGCAMAVGPIDGNTWRPYRFVTERGSERPFFLEPDNPDAWPDHFASAGFTVVATYASAVAEDLGLHDTRCTAAKRRLATTGVTIRSLNGGALDQELRRIHALSCRAFERNFLYVPLDEQEFVDQYRRLLPFVCADLVLLAEHEGDLVGLLFAVPDILRARGGAALRRSAGLRVGGTVDTVVIKTVAVAPGRAYAGLGSVLVAEAHDRAARMGYSRAIHALMHEENVSRNISRRYARTFRRYALFARRLANCRGSGLGIRGSGFGLETLNLEQNPEPETRNLEPASPESRIPDPER